MKQRTKGKQREYVPGRARQLAASGEFIGWHAIEIHLRYEEHCPEARHILDDERTRGELDRICQEARASTID